MKILPLLLVLLILIMVFTSIKVVNTGYLFVLERLGQFHKVLEPGWHFTIPFADFVRKRVSTKQQILDIEPQNVITKDNVKISIDNVIFYKVMDARAAVYNIENYQSGIVYSTITNMRNIVGNMSLDDVLSGRDKINNELLMVVDEITDAYGIKILSVEIKNILPPTEIQQAMEKQMRAERDKRATILQAEGEKQSDIARAEGEKQAKILQAEAEKEANIRRAEGSRQSQILEAEGEAEAILKVQTATAEGIKRINESLPSEAVIKIKALEAFAAAANGQATKIIIPSEIQGLAGLATSFKEVMSDPK